MIAEKHTVTTSMYKNVPLIVVVRLPLPSGEAKCSTGSVTKLASDNIHYVTYMYVDIYRLSGCVVGTFDQRKMHLAPIIR